MGVVGRESYHKGRDKGGVVFIFLHQVSENSRIIDVVTKNDRFYTHKQVEVRDGLLFIRLKKRSLINIHA